MNSADRWNLNLVLVDRKCFESIDSSKNSTSRRVVYRSALYDFKSDAVTFLKLTPFQSTQA